MTSNFRFTANEQARTSDLLGLTPRSGEVALDVGARDGHFSLLLADRFERVIALDLVRPSVLHPRVECVEADARQLPYADASIDFVLCAEVLEHVPPPAVRSVCAELQRVCSQWLLIGVPYRQDIRVGRTTCYSCMKPNPPWGHVNSFDKSSLVDLFPAFEVERWSFVGESRERTNALSCVLLDRAGNPYGTYAQEEPCIHCGRRLLPPPPRNWVRKAATKLGYWTRAPTMASGQPRPNWVHLLLRRPAPGAAKPA